MASKTFRRSAYSILFWSILAAAFVGPGTVTTAAAAGAQYGFSLAWALVFSVLACMVIQETAARIPLASGKSLGDAIAYLLGDSKRGKGIRWALSGAIYIGGIAYQAGNLLGAKSGLQLIFPNGERYLFLLMVILGSVVLWKGTEKYIAQILGILVGVMALLFIGLAVCVIWSDLGFRVFTHSSAESTSLFTHMFPVGAEAIILGLIGTTIVPYNIFLASGLARQEDVSTQRIGIYGAVLLGGILTASIMIVGSAIEGVFSFASLAEVLNIYFGPSGKVILGIGLWAAGFTSSLTAPLAAAITARSMFTNKKNASQWLMNATRARLIWGSIMLIGTGFALSGVQPVPAIILAQALNGLLLPFVVISLVWVINEAQLIPPPYRNSVWANIFLYTIIWVTLILGLRSLWKVWGQLRDLSISEEGGLGVIITIATFITLIIIIGLNRKKQPS